MWEGAGGFGVLSLSGLEEGGLMITQESALVLQGGGGMPNDLQEFSGHGRSLMQVALAST
eukprot:5154489-Amphidinium_carterae.1